MTSAPPPQAGKHLRWCSCVATWVLATHCGGGRPADGSCALALVDRQHSPIGGQVGEACVCVDRKGRVARPDHSVPRLRVFRRVQMRGGHSVIHTTPSRSITGTRTERTAAGGPSGWAAHRLLAERQSAAHWEEVLCRPGALRKRIETEESSRRTWCRETAMCRNAHRRHAMYLRASPLERGHERRHGQDGRGMSHDVPPEPRLRCTIRPRACNCQGALCSWVAYIAA